MAAQTSRSAGVHPIRVFLIPMLNRLFLEHLNPPMGKCFSIRIRPCSVCLSVCHVYPTGIETQVH